MHFLSKQRKKLYSIGKKISVGKIFSTVSRHESNLMVTESNQSTTSALLTSLLNQRNEITTKAQPSQSTETQERIVTPMSAIPSMNNNVNVFDIKRINLVDVIKHIPQKVNNMNSKVAFDEETLSAAHNLGGLFVNQITIEENQLSEARKSYEEMTKGLIRMGRGTGMKKIQNTMLHWFEDFRDEIVKEVKLVKTQVPGKDRMVSYTTNTLIN